MKAAEFIRSCERSGYCSAAKAEEFVKKNRKAEYTPDDFVEAYRFGNKFYGRKPGVVCQRQS